MDYGVWARSFDKAVIVRVAPLVFIFMAAMTPARRLNDNREDHPRRDGFKRADGLMCGRKMQLKGMGAAVRD